ncbi:MAG: prepilin-type N-terminal cleavage/methylation domain-containing protein [Bdellovibrionales bacterium]|nr:prepilin-type N-terminal cleavage/methylation domain-containing protein [Bdellovibrionales bacterium]
MILKNSKAFSLLEILVALSIFTFLFLSIVQIVKQTRRHVNKIQGNLQAKDSIYNSLNLIKRDLSSSTYFLDLNQNLKQNFPLEESDLKNPKKPKNLKAPLFLDSQIAFKGKSQEMEFVSYTFSQKDSFKQWLRIRYIVESCPDEIDSPSCLMRYETPYWNAFEREDLKEDKLVVLKNFESLNFSYSSDFRLLNSKWEDFWSVEKDFRKLKGVPFFSLPVRVQMNVKNKETALETWIFFVSNKYLHEWNPYSKGFTSFSKL